MKTIGVVTSGGDAPGMNAAIRAVVRIAYANNFQVVGFEKGWEGLMTNTLRQLTPRSVGGIINLLIVFGVNCQCINTGARTALWR